MTEVPAAFLAALRDRYTIERPVGRGGMATVYLARDLKHDRDVAIKMLLPEIAATLGPARFLREIRIAAGLTHRHILPLHDSGEAGGYLYYVMPYVEGETLRDRLAREQQLPVDDALRLAREVAEALDYAHRQNVVHRDIKPENILLQEGHAIVADFGVARAIDAAQSDRMTETGLAVGTPYYMSPEQASGDRPLDGRSDVYALACVLYEMLAGEPPYTGPGAQAVISKAMVDPVPAVSRIRSSVPTHVSQAIARALAKSPVDRYDTAVAFADALAQPSGTEPAASRPRPRRRRAAVAAGVVALAAAGWFGLRNARSPASTTSLSTVAVLPFAVRGGPEVSYLGEGMVDLLTTKLDGAGEMRGLDPHLLLAMVRQHAAIADGGAVDPGAARSIAERAGAGLFILGSVVEAGGQLQLRGTLYDTRRGAAAGEVAVVEGGMDQLFGLVDQLATRLLASRYRDVGNRLTRLAALTTPSVPALKAYLEGERLFRLARWDAAYGAFLDAVQLDSTFALANYRLAVAEAFVPGPVRALSGPAVERALRYADRLPARDRALLQAYRAVEDGRGSEAERLYRDIVAAHPDEIEAWFQLGDILFHFNPTRGRPIGDARMPFERVRGFDPDHGEALVHLMELAGIERNWVEFDSLFQRLDPAATFAPSARVGRAFASGDSAMQAAARAELHRSEDPGLYTVVLHAAFLMDDLDAVEQIVRILTEPPRSAGARVSGHVTLAMLQVARGRAWPAVRAELDSARPLDASRALEMGAWLAAWPFVDVPREDLDEIRGALERWRPGRAPDQGVVGRLQSGHESVQPEVRLYLLGLVNARLGRRDAALDYAAQLERAADSVGGIVRDLVRGVRAYAAFRNDDPDGVVTALDGLAAEALGGSVVYSPFWARTLERYLLARSYQDLGRERDAAQWFASFTEHSAFAVVARGRPANR